MLNCNTKQLVTIPTTHFARLHRASILHRLIRHALMCSASQFNPKSTSRTILNNTSLTAVRERRQNQIPRTTVLFIATNFVTHKGCSKSSYTDTVKHKICKSYFVAFQQSFLQLKCTWSGVSPKLRLRCRGTGVHSFLLFQPAICRADNGPHSKLSLCMERPEPPCPQSKRHLNRFSWICRAQHYDRLTVDTSTYRAIGRIYIVVRCGLRSCAVL